MPVNQQEWRAASKILLKAVDLINEHGWQQGAEAPTTQQCLATSIEEAYKEGDYTIVDFNYTREALSRILKVSREPEHKESDSLDVPYWGRNFMEWNDAPGRKKEDVVDALKSASQLAQQLAEKSR